MDATTLAHDDQTTAARPALQTQTAWMVCVVFSPQGSREMLPNLLAER